MVKSLKAKVKKPLPGRVIDEGINKAWRKLNAGDFEGANQMIKRLIEHNPENSTLWHRLGIIFLKKDQFEDAVIAISKAAQLSPTQPEIIASLAQALHRTGKHEKSLQLFDYIEATYPNFTDVHFFKAELFHVFRDLKEARQALQKFLELRKFSDNTFYEILYDFNFPYLMGEEEANARLKEILSTEDKWLKNNKYFPDLPVHYPELPFPIAYYDVDVRPALELLNKVLRKTFPDLNYTTPHLAEIITRPLDDKIKIGFVSQFVGRKHAVGHCYNNLIINLNKEIFETYIFYIGDPTHNKVDLNANKKITLDATHLAFNREQIEKEKLDIIVYLDIGMVAMSHYLAMSRLAPIQCVTHGHPITSGCSTVDYFLTSKIWESEKDQKYYTEKLALLDGVHLYYDIPEMPSKIQMDKIKSTQFPAGARLYGCPQTFFKFSDQMFRIFERILQQDENAWLVIINRGEFWSQQVFERLAKTMPKNNFRVINVVPMDHQEFNYFLSIHHVLLDTSPFGGGNTTLQSFYTGTPVVALDGNYVRGRMTAAYYRLMGITDLIAHDEDDYVQKAIRVANDKEFRENIKNKILEKNSILFRNPQAIQSHEKFFTEKVKRLRS